LICTPMIEKIVQTAKQTVKAAVLAHRARERSPSAADSVAASPPPPIALVVPLRAARCARLLVRAGDRLLDPHQCGPAGPGKIRSEPMFLKAKSDQHQLETRFTSMHILICRGRMGGRTGRALPCRTADR
jgi:hypothetical protein